MADNRERFYAAAPSHPELAGIWLRAAGIVLVGRDGRRDLIAWDRCAGVAWEADQCTVHGDGVELRIDGRLANWDGLGRTVAADIAVWKTGRLPRGPVPDAAKVRRPPPPAAFDVSPLEIRAWLGTEAGQALCHTAHKPLWLRVIAWTVYGLTFGPPLLLFLLFVILAPERGWPLLLFYAFACLVLAWLCAEALKPVRWRADEHGITRLDAMLPARRLWCDLCSVYDRSLAFTHGSMELPAGESGDRVLAAARQICHAMSVGGRLPAEATVPAAALSRMRGDRVEAPATALSRTAGGDDA